MQSAIMEWNHKDTRQPSLPSAQDSLFHEQTNEETSQRINKTGNMTTALVLFLLGIMSGIETMSQKKMGLCETGVSQQVLQMERQV